MLILINHIIKLTYCFKTEHLVVKMHMLASGTVDSAAPGSNPISGNFY